MALLAKMVDALGERATCRDDACFVGASKSRSLLPFALLRRAGCCCGVNSRAVQRIIAAAVMGPHSDRQAEFLIVILILQGAEGAEGGRVGRTHHSPQR